MWIGVPFIETEKSWRVAGVRGGKTTSCLLDNYNWYTVKYSSRGIRERGKKTVMIAKERAG